MQRPEYRTGRHERAVKIYTVCDESRFLIVRNVPALGCVDELIKLFGLYGDIEEYRLLDEEDCEPFTDVYWIKYAQYSNSRFAKRKLDKYRFLGSPLQVSYAPNYETLTDTKTKLEERRRAVLNRIQTNQLTGPGSQVKQPASHLKDPLLIPLRYSLGTQQYPPSPLERLPHKSGGQGIAGPQDKATLQRTAVEHNHVYSASTDAIVQSVREKLNRISDIQALPRAAGQEVSEDTREMPVIGKGKRPIEEENSSIMRKQQQGTRKRI